MQARHRELEAAAHIKTTRGPTIKGPYSFCDAKDGQNKYGIRTERHRSVL